MDRGSELFPLASRILEAAETRGPLTLLGLEALVSSPHEKTLLNKALRFLLDRNQVLLDVEGQTFHSRKWLTGRIARALAQQEPVSIASLAQTCNCGIATCCDVLGWLERGGHVRLLPGELVEALSPPPRNGSVNPDASSAPE